MFVIPAPTSNLQSVISDASCDDKLQVLLVITGNADHTCRWLSTVSHVAPPTFPCYLALLTKKPDGQQCLEMLKMMVKVLVSLVSGQPLAPNLGRVEGEQIGEELILPVSLALTDEEASGSGSLRLP